jgi:ubiquinone/menaquinone biosynthesis C-methylase UbiE
MMSSEERQVESPWLYIPASDYEGHMGPDGTDQMSVLNRVFRKVYQERKPASMAVLGCGTGNGFEHIDRTITHRAVGIDINARYLEIARRRCCQLTQTVEFECAAAEQCEFEPESFDLVHAALIFEYVDPGPMLDRITSWLRPKGAVSAVLQLPSKEQGVVTKTLFSSVQTLEESIRLVEPERLGQLAGDAGLSGCITQTFPLRHGKGFFLGVFEKPA